MTASVQVLDTSALAGWRFKLGILIFSLAFALWLVIPLAAALQVSIAHIAAGTGAIFAVNKALLLVCVAVLGRAGFQRLKAMVSAYVKGLPGRIGAFGHAVPSGPARDFITCLAMLAPNAVPHDTVSARSSVAGEAAPPGGGGQGLQASRKARSWAPASSATKTLQSPRRLPTCEARNLQAPRWFSVVLAANAKRLAEDHRNRTGAIASLRSGRFPTYPALS